MNYFITLNFNDIKFDIIKPIGKSAHLSLKEHTPKNELGNVIINKEIIYPFNKTINDSEKIANKLINALKEDKKIKSVFNLINELRNIYKIRVKK